MDHMDEMQGFEAVRDCVARTLGVTDRAGAWQPDTELFGNVPELDSLAVVEVVAALEQRFGITLEADDLTIDTFATVGALHALVLARSGGAVVGGGVAG